MSGRWLVVSMLVWTLALGGACGGDRPAPQRPSGPSPATVPSVTSAQGPLTATPAIVPASGPRDDAPEVPLGPPLVDIAQLSVGHSHVCAVTAAQTVVCWGDNAAGQLGIGASGRPAPRSLSRPHVVGNLPPIARVAAGKLHTCALANDGDVYCWGSAGGDLRETAGGAAGSIELRDEGLGRPLRVPLGEGRALSVTLSTTTSAACATFADEVRCRDTHRLIALDGRSVKPPELRTVKLARVTSFALAHGKACAISGKALACWRSGTAPAVVPMGRGFTPATVALGQMYACVASTSGAARCWTSLVDDFWTRTPDREIRWPGKRPTRAVTVGDSPVCAIDDQGRVDCFWSDEAGLPDGVAELAWATVGDGPFPVEGIDMAVEIGLGLGRNTFAYGFGCVRRATRDAGGAQIVCWGDNESGQLGDGTERTPRRPVAVLTAIED